MRAPIWLARLCADTLRSFLFKQQQLRQHQATFFLFPTRSSTLFCRSNRYLISSPPARSPTTRCVLLSCLTLTSTYVGGSHERGMLLQPSSLSGWEGKRITEFDCGFLFMFFCCVWEACFLWLLLVCCLTVVYAYQILPVADRLHHRSRPNSSRYRPLHQSNPNFGQRSTMF